jgi:hypothetical protein
LISSGGQWWIPSPPGSVAGMCIISMYFTSCPLSIVVPFEALALTCRNTWGILDMVTTKIETWAERGWRTAAGL